MKTGRVNVIFVTDQAWSVGVAEAGGVSIVGLPPADPPVPAQQAARGLREFLDQSGYDGHGVVLAIPSSWCLCAAIETDELQLKPTPEALTFKLEDQLPVAAEEVVADFVTTPKRALGVAVCIDRLGPLVECLEDHGVAVQYICPTAMLAAQGATPVQPGHDPRVALWANGDATEMITFDAQQPASWYHLRSNRQAVKLAFAALAVNADAPPAVTTHGVSGDVTRSLETLASGWTVTGDGQQLEPAAAATAGEVLAGRINPWINLRRGPLAVRDPLRQVRLPLNCAVAAAAVFLITVNLVLFWQTRQHHDTIGRHATLQEVIFTELFPGRRVPLNVRSRLASEKRHLEAIKGQSTPLANQASTLNTLYQVLRGLPADARFRVSDLRLGGDRLDLSGQARSHSQADAVANALNQHSPFVVSQPSTEQLPDGGVVFKITGQKQIPTAPATSLAGRDIR